MAIRVRVTALFIRGDKVLLIENLDDGFLHYNLPGGGLDEGETLEEGLRREVREETACEIGTMGDLVLVWEHLSEQQSDFYGTKHGLSLVFCCELAEGQEPRLPDHPDEFQTDVVWMPIDRLDQIALLPQISTHLQAIVRGTMQGVPIKTLRT